MKFRPKPITVEAKQWDGTHEKALEIGGWCNGEVTLTAHGFTSPGVFSMLRLDIRQTNRFTTERFELYSGSWLVKHLTEDSYDCLTAYEFFRLYDAIPEAEQKMSKCDACGRETVTKSMGSYTCFAMIDGSRCTGVLVSKQ